jgi:hypothetical protein
MNSRYGSRRDRGNLAGRASRMSFNLSSISGTYPVRICFAHFAHTRERQLNYNLIDIERKLDEHLTDTEQLGRRAGTRKPKPKA